MHSHRTLSCSFHSVPTLNIPRLRTGPVSTATPFIARRLLSQQQQHQPTPSRLLHSYLSTPPISVRDFPNPFTQSHRSYSAVTTNMDRLKDTLHPGILSEVLNLWFNHIPSPEHLILPPKEAMFKWFKADSDFDKTCTSQLSPYLSTISSVRPTASELLSTVSPSSSLDWLGLVLLLDQVSRNVFRGAEAKMVYEVFDPLAQEVVNRAVAAGVLEDPVVKYRLAYRVWFGMPFMHSESRGLHEACVGMFEAGLADVRGLVSGREEKVDGEVAKCRAYLKEHLEEAEGYLETFLGFEKRHQVIIERFGRYPHRNRVMGRESTKEEEEYLRDGGETFGTA